MSKTPLTLLTGALGSGKTTLLRQILEHPDRKIAILMNEFGEIAIDTKTLKTKNVEIAELDGGCVCCSLLGEFEAAINEIIDTVNPEVIVVETTGLAEPEALIFDIENSLPQVRLDGVITIVDADGMLRFPQLGRTTSMQIEDADLILLNKTDLVTPNDLEQIEKKLQLMNPGAAIFFTTYCQLDRDLLFGIGREKKLLAPIRPHQHDFQRFSYTTSTPLDPERFKHFAQTLPSTIVRAKGFVVLGHKTFLFNFVSGRWDLEPFEEDGTALVFIGKGLDSQQIISQLKDCEV